MCDSEEEAAVNQALLSRISLSIMGGERFILQRTVVQATGPPSKCHEISVQAITLS